jgi:hypothetical protein
VNFVKKSFPLFLIFVSSFLMLAQVSFAQSQSARTTRLNFEDELIQGDVSSPDLLFILKSKNANYGKLLKLRDHFLPEINDTKYDILRGAK